MASNECDIMLVDDGPWCSTHKCYADEDPHFKPYGGIVMVHDLVDPNDAQGRTYKQINAEKMHTIPLDTFAEINCDYLEWHRVRLYVVGHGRDCDQTPLYSLGVKGRAITHGWSENSLRILSCPDCPQALIDDPAEKHSYHCIAGLGPTCGSCCSCKCGQEDCTSKCRCS